ncbi:MAG: twin-arginine translocase subunit TatC [Tepidisphaeraceae bacterium]
MPEPVDYAPYDPESYRMTLGDHLEELRRRLIYALLGFAVAAVVCLFFGRDVLSYFCKPLWDTLVMYDVNPTLVIKDVSDGFSVYIQISMICACVIASPWMVWQLWLFVAAGLYPNERKTVTRYVPLSITLLIAGDLFVYFLILPWTLQWLMSFSLNIPLPQDTNYLPPNTQAVEVFHVPKLAGTPATLPETHDWAGMWYDTYEKRLKIVIENKVRTLQFGSENLVTPQIQLPEYVDLVLNMLMVFGLSFQLPLVVLALIKIGVIEVDQVKGLRRIVYFIMAIVAAVITPGDAITATVGLMLPLCLLFELGVWLGARSEKADKKRLEA